MLRLLSRVSGGRLSLRSALQTPIRSYIDPKVLAASITPSQKTNILLKSLPESINKSALTSIIRNEDGKSSVVSYSFKILPLFYAA